MYILNQLDYSYTDYVLLKDALLDTHVREADVIEKRNIIRQIRDLDFDTDTETFKSSLDRACAAIHGEYLVPRSLASLRKIKTFKVHGIDAGFALAPLKGTNGYPELVAFHNASRYGRLGMHLLFAAQELGARYLECFGRHLGEILYVSYGFETYKTIENVKMRNGKIETLYFMKLKGYPAPRA